MTAGNRPNEAQPAPTRRDSVEYDSSRPYARISTWAVPEGADQVEINGQMYTREAYWEDGWLRSGDLAVCPECKRVKEGTISWGLMHERECDWHPAGTWLKKRISAELEHHRRESPEPAVDYDPENPERPVPGLPDRLEVARLSEVVVIRNCEIGTLKLFARRVLERVLRKGCIENHGHRRRETGCDECRDLYALADASDFDLDAMERAEAAEGAPPCASTEKEKENGSDGTVCSGGRDDEQDRGDVRNGEGSAGKSRREADGLARRAPEPPPQLGRQGVESDDAPHPVGAVQHPAEHAGGEPAERRDVGLVAGERGRVPGDADADAGSLVERGNPGARAAACGRGEDRAHAPDEVAGARVDRDSSAEPRLVATPSSGYASDHERAMAWLKDVFKPAYDSAISGNDLRLDGHMLADHFEAIRAEEREACAQAVESMTAHTPGERAMRYDAAAHVRARSTHPKVRRG